MAKDKKKQPEQEPEAQEKEPQSPQPEEAEPKEPSAADQLGGLGLFFLGLGSCPGCFFVLLCHFPGL